MGGVGVGFLGGVGLGRFCFEVADFAGVDRFAEVAGVAELDESAEPVVGFWVSRLWGFRPWAFRFWLPRFDLDELADLADLVALPDFA